MTLSERWCELVDKFEAGMSKKERAEWYVITRADIMICERTEVSLQQQDICREANVSTEEFTELFESVGALQQAACNRWLTDCERVMQHTDGLTADAAFACLYEYVAMPGSRGYARHLLDARSTADGPIEQLHRLEEIVRHYVLTGRDWTPEMAERKRDSMTKFCTQRMLEYVRICMVSRSRIEEQVRYLLSNARQR